MNTPRLAGNLRREQILDAARSCFARFGYAGTTTRSVAAAAAISEGLLFKHFSTKAALYAEILAEACEADPEFHRLLELQPSTETLVTLVREMVVHFMRITDGPDHDEVQRIRLMMSSHLDDGEFARLLFEKIGALIGPVFLASLDNAIAAGDARASDGKPMDLFWIAHQTLHMIALTRLPGIPTVPYPQPAVMERQVCLFILRGLGLEPHAIETHFEMAPAPDQARRVLAESA